MAAQADYTAVANALVLWAHGEINRLLATLPEFEAAIVESKITAAMVSSEAGSAAKVAVDTLDAARAARNQLT